MRGLILGNSHVGAVREGWVESRPIDVDFYAVPGAQGPNLKLDDGLFFPARKNGLVRSTVEGARDAGLDVRGYDYIVFCNLWLGAVREEFTWHVLRQLSLGEFSRPDIEETMPVSRAFLHQAIVQSFSNMPAAAALRAIRTVYDGPVMCVPGPIPVVEALEKAHPLRRIYGKDLAAFMAWSADTQIKIFRDFAEPLGYTVLDYLDPSWCATGSTPTEYVSTDNDPWHMNAAYGSRVIKQVQETLAII